MANPLKMLKLKPAHFQLIQEVKIDAPPRRAWAALLDMGGWFRFDPTDTKRHCKCEPWVGGRFYAEYADGSSALHAIITYIEPEKLLRLSGAMGLTHLPVSNAFIFELQPKGQGTLLRMCHRAFGYMDSEVGKRYGQGWKQLLPQIKALAEEKPKATSRKSARKR